MIRKAIVTAAVAGLLTTGASGVATAEAAPPPPPEWVPVFYFGTQTYCNQAGAWAEQHGAVPPGRWKCDSGWLMVRPPEQG